MQDLGAQISDLSSIAFLKQHPMPYFIIIMSHLHFKEFDGAELHISVPRFCKQLGEISFIHIFCHQVRFLVFIDSKELYDIGMRQIP